MNKAYIVTTDSSDASVLCFAKSPSRAKAMATCTDWLCDEKYTELTCRREPKADKYVTEKETYFDGSTVEECRIMRRLGWFEIEGTEEACSVCDLHEWHNVPESHLIEICGELTCGEC